MLTASYTSTATAEINHKLWAASYSAYSSSMAHTTGSWCISILSASGLRKADM
jgi:hypothetical protein